MIGIQEDMLNMVLVTHFLLLLSNLALVVLFSILVMVRNDPKFRAQLGRTGGGFFGFGGAGRRVQAPQPVYTEPARDRTGRRGLGGWFGR